MTESQAYFQYTAPAPVQHPSPGNSHTHASPNSPLSASQTHLPDASPSPPDTPSAFRSMRPMTAPSFFSLPGALPPLSAQGTPSIPPLSSQSGREPHVLPAQHDPSNPLPQLPVSALHSQPLVNPFSHVAPDSSFWDASSLSPPFSAGAYPSRSQSDFDLQPRPNTADPVPYAHLGAVPVPGGTFIPGNPRNLNLVPAPEQPKKRARRRYDEIERMYACNYPGCTKAYGTLNHLNAHINMQKHGEKRLPHEFKELRKEYRARKKAEEAFNRKKTAEAAASATVRPSDALQTLPPGVGLSPFAYNASQYSTASAGTSAQMNPSAGPPQQAQAPSRVSGSQFDAQLPASQLIPPPAELPQYYGQGHPQAPFMSSSSQIQPHYASDLTSSAGFLPQTSSSPSRNDVGNVSLASPLKDNPQLPRASRSTSNGGIKLEMPDVNRS